MRPTRRRWEGLARVLSSEDREVLASMLEAGRWCLVLARDMTLKTLAANEAILDEVERGLMAVGAKADVLSREFRHEHGDWPWKMLANMRVLPTLALGNAHGEMVWRLVQERVPSLLTLVESALGEVSQSNSEPPRDRW